jgi:hypothetical protein
MATYSRSPHSSPGRKFWPWVAIPLGAGVGVLLLLGSGYGFTTTTSFSGQIATPYTGCIYGCLILSHTEYLPAGKYVTTQWVDSSGGLVIFEVRGPGMGELSQCNWAAASDGACSFTSASGNYSFSAGNAPGTTDRQVVNYSGSYLTPIF